MYLFSFAIGTAFFASRVLAVPSPLGIMCELENGYSNVKTGKPWNKAPQLVGGYRCTSDLTDTCSLGSDISFSENVSVKVSSTVSANGLDLGKILTLGATNDVDYSWSKTTASGESASVNCPAGKLTCGIQVIASMVTTTGTFCKTWIPAMCGKQMCGKFSVEAPELQGDGPSEAMRTVMDFQACLVSCADGTTTCAAAKKAGIPTCPK